MSRGARVEVDASHLVVGADSLVGAELIRSLERRGESVIGSTRRADTVAAAGSRRVYLDFDRDGDLPAVEHAFIVAAQTSYERCESDPATWRTNVEAIPRLAARLLESGARVTFVSTNSVFGGERPWPCEYDEVSPAIGYAKQKAAGEALIRKAAERLGAKARLAIVRLTKILGPKTAPLPAWFEAWRRGESVEAFRDLVFAPMSVRYVADGLAKIAESRLSGVFHLSGEENLTYVEFARSLAERLGLWNAVVESSSAEKGLSIAFKPRYSGISMQRTTTLTGISPQPLKAVVSDLLRYAKAVH